MTLCSGCELTFFWCRRYLSGLALKTGGPEHFPTARVHLKAAIEMLDKIQSQSPDKAATAAELKPKYDAVKTVLYDIKQAAAAAGSGAPASSGTKQN